MKPSRISIAVLCLTLICLARPQGVLGAESPRTEAQKIEALIKHVETLKDATFVRNGSDYDAKSAAKFLRGKWQSQEKSIKTATQFIDKAASTSSTSGKPYVICFKGARTVNCGDYLKEELKKLESRAPEAPRKAE